MHRKEGLVTDSRRNLVLIGMSGAGKSTLGVLLAKALGMDFCDTDLLLQRQAGKKLQTILNEDGIDAFLQLEESVLSALSVRDCVIATGGSAVYSARGMEALRQNGTIVYLAVPYAELEKRLCNITTRGIVRRSGSTLRDVYEERLPLYQRYADITVACGGRAVERSVETVLQALR